jgi:SAM-dependent methyltransferase
MAELSKHLHTPQAGDETSAAKPRRLQEGFYAKYIDNKLVMDIGPGHTPISPTADTWDHSKGDGDAMFMAGVSDGKYDTVYSSHVLEHLDDPQTALVHWLRIVKREGHLIVSVPDEDLYEQEVWPPIFNPDHRFSYTAYKSQSWNRANSKNLIELVMKLEAVKLISLRIVDTNYNYELKYQDQPLAEKSVEVIVQKLGLVPAYKVSLYQGFACFCGCKEVILLGMYITGELMIECRDCKHRGKLSTPTILKELGFDIEYKHK